MVTTLNRYQIKNFRVVQMNNCMRYADQKGDA